MKTYARIVNNTAVEVVKTPDGISIGEMYTPDIAKDFVEVPSAVVVGSTVDNNGAWTHPVPVSPPIPVQPAAPIPIRELTTVEFELLFTYDEVKAISTYPTTSLEGDRVAYYWSMLQHRIKTVSITSPLVVEVLELLETLDLIAAGRKAAILAAGTLVASKALGGAD